MLWVPTGTWDMGKPVIRGVVHRVAPRLAKVRVKVARWSNCSQHCGEPLVDPRYLTAVNRALDKCVDLVIRRTIPTLTNDERLLPETYLREKQEEWLVESLLELAKKECREYLEARQIMEALATSSQEFRATFGTLLQEWQNLEKSWPSALAKARRRLGDRFRAENYPAACDIWKAFRVCLEASDYEIVCTTDLLGDFSTFQPRDPVPQTTDSG